MEEDKKEVSLSSILDSNSQMLVSEVVGENDPEKLKELISLFNINQSKKNLIRIDTFSKLMDKVSDQMVERLSKKAGEFSNKDLLDYMSAIRSAIDTNELDAKELDLKPLVVHNTQVNINTNTGDVLDRDSKEKVANVVDLILKNLGDGNKTKKEVIDIDNTDNSDGI